MIRQTSKQAFEGIQKELQKRELEVFEVIEMCTFTGITNHEISKFLKWEINRVTGRTYSLSKKGFIKIKEKRPDLYTGYNSIAWTVNDLGVCYYD